MSVIKVPNVFAGKGTLYNGKIELVPPPGGIHFGKFCAIGPGLAVMGTNHDWNYPAIQYTFYRKYFGGSHPVNRTKKTYSKGKIIIGNDVWFGNDVIVFSGVTIGDGCIIGAKSVVTKDLPPYSICVGSPCKAIKYRYSEEVRQYLLDLKWWDWSDEKIRQNRKFFHSDLNDLTLPEIQNMIS